MRRNTTLRATKIPPLVRKDGVHQFYNSLLASYGLTTYDKFMNSLLGVKVRYQNLICGKYHISTLLIRSLTRVKVVSN